MKNKLLNILLICTVFFTFTVNAFAALTNESNILAKRNNLNTIAQYNYISMVNKSELIGYRLENFNFATSQYKNTARLAAERVNSAISQIDVIRNSSDFSDSEKELQVNNLFQEIDAILYDLDSKTLEYAYSLRSNMPTITYRKYVKTFLDFYNSKNMTNSKISLE